MAYHYVASSQPPTSVTHAVVASFTGVGETNLIIGKATRLEGHLYDPEGGLTPVFDVPVNARLATLNVLPGQVRRRTCPLLAYCARTAPHNMHRMVNLTGYLC